MKKKLFFFNVKPLAKPERYLFTVKNLLFLLLPAMLITGCKKITEEPGLTSECPIVVSTIPANGATGVSLNSLVTATFNKAIDPATINSSTFTLKRGATPIAGLVTYSGLTAVFSPAVNFLPNTTYTGTITTGVRDSAHNALQVNYIWSFTTGTAPDTIPPRVILTDPANGDSNVIRSKVITATFSKVMNPATINTNTFTLRQGTTLIPGTVTYAGSTASFTPTANLAFNTTYTATITTGARDMANNALVSNYVWSFTTVPAPPDVTAPTVISTDPTNGATNVPLNRIISATFSEAMDPATITNTTFLLMQGATAIAGSVSYSGTTAFFVPTVPLLVNTPYTATITTGAKDVAGNSLAANYVWTFSTTTFPAVISTIPANGAQGVPLNQIISATFSEAMNPTTINNTTFLLMRGAIAVPGTVTYAGNTATFTPTVPLLAGIVYTATITTGAQNLAGNGLVANYVWTFSTSTIPTVISTVPTNGATGVPLNQIISATFSEAMNPLTINNTTFLLMRGAISVPGTVTYAGATNTASFTPAAPLLNGTPYTATITTQARNLAGNGLATNYVWTFTTLLAVPPPPPPNILGTAAQFGVFGGSAGMTNDGLNTLIFNGSIGTTAVASTITGFYDATTFENYTVTPLNRGVVTGRIHAAPPPPGSAASMIIATQGRADALIAYNLISPAGTPGGTDPTPPAAPGELGNLTLTPGIYKSAGGSFAISAGNLTLDAQNNPNAQWFFQAPTSLTVGAPGVGGGRSVIVINAPANFPSGNRVYWYVGSAATINGSGAGGGVMVGTIISSAGVTFSTVTAGNVLPQVVLNGRALSLGASVTMVNTTINVPN